MTDIQPKVALDGRYSVCEAARRLGCHRQTLWRYAERLHITPNYNQLNNRWFFTGKQLHRIWRAAM